ncbi:MAG: MFS transporter [Deltaproteobacteria bacterium]|nr:MFS transporter [Deltaproteobacteria bacterium]
MTSRGSRAFCSNKPLRWPEFFGFAAGDFGFSFYWKVFEFYLLVFYTDSFGISPAQAGTMFLITRVLDAALDPVMGMLADRTNTRWGKFRPYLLWFALPLVASAVLTFTTPHLDQADKLVWAYVTYTMTMLAYTAANIPYGALLGVITPDPQKRTVLATFMIVGSNAAGTVVTWVTLPLVNRLANGDLRVGWQRLMVLYGAIAVAMLFIAFASTRERVQPPPHQRSSMRQDLGDLVSNGPWLTLLGLGLVVILAVAIRNGVGVYYLKYYCKREDLVSWFNTASSLAYLAGAMCTPLLTRFFTKKDLFCGLMALVAALSAAMYFVPPQSIALLFVLNTLTSFVVGPKSPLSWSMFADSADFSEWKTGRRATALVFAAATFSIKAGAGVAQALTGWLLSAFGYVANTAQTPRAMSGILVLATLIPAALALCAAIMVRLYSLSATQLAVIHVELEARRLS